MRMQNWQNELKNRVCHPHELPAVLALTEEEARFCRSIEEGMRNCAQSALTAGEGTLPFALTPYFLRLLCEYAEQAACDGSALSPEGIAAGAAYAALRRQVIPSPQENTVLGCELEDPLGESLYRVCSRLVHQYKNRCLLLATGLCTGYCRHCFRRRYTERGEGFIGGEELKDVCLYLEKHSEVEEILVSGGDPLCASDEQIRLLFSSLRRARPGILLRVCTRSPVFLPSRFTPELVFLFKSFRPLWVIPHINHPAELSEESEAALALLIDNGIPVQSQTVLLHGINDDAHTLKVLFNRLVRLGVKPGYLFQGDLAPGTSHLRVPIDEGLALYGRLKEELSGLSLPVYAADLPGGGGKYNLARLEDSLSGNFPVKKDNGWYIRDAGGRVWMYPRY